MIQEKKTTSHINYQLIPIFIGLGRVTDFPTCGGVKNDPWSPDVFYHFIAPAAGQYQVDTCPGELISPSDTKISVFSGECDEPVCIGGNDDSGRNCGFGSEVFFEANEAGAFLDFSQSKIKLFPNAPSPRPKIYNHGSRFQEKHWAISN